MKLTPKQWNWIVLGIFAINFILIFIVFYQLKMEKDTCLSDPLKFGAKLLTEANKAEFSCTCVLSSNNLDFVSPIITFDQYGMDVEHITREVKKYETNFNISEFEEMFK